MCAGRPSRAPGGLARAWVEAPSAGRKAAGSCIPTRATGGAGYPHTPQPPSPLPPPPTPNQPHQDGWLLDRPVIESYLQAVEAAYLANSYHNAYHAADVVQTALVVMASTQQRLSSAAPSTSAAAARPNPFTRLEQFAVIFSAAVHDLGHPGVNNDFLVRSRAPMAVRYNDT
jgi:hypothetical protein